MRSVFVLLSWLVVCVAAHAASPQVRYVREEVTIPMRDGLHLHAVVLRPAPDSAHAREALPVLLNRTPYGVAGNRPENLVKQYREFATAGYIFVFEDIRGRYGSEGSFVMMRPLAPYHDAVQHPHDVDESTDAYDSVAWLVAHLPRNNGRVGVFGVSYDGFLTTMAGIDAHPAIKAISPQAPMTDVWQGDDFFHNGAFRQTYGFDYAVGMESSKENAFGKLEKDAYDYFLSAGSFAAAAERAEAAQHLGRLPTWQAFLAHPADDAYWQQRAVQTHMEQVSVPTLEVGGWWDQEDMWGPQAQYAALASRANAPAAYLVLGPWNHGEWRGEARALGPLQFGHATGASFRAQVEAPFFAYYLRPAGKHKQAPRGAPIAPITSYQTGSNRWEHYASWPPANVHAQALYFGAAKTLGFQKPAEAVNPGEQASAYASNPADPVPYRARPIEATYAPTGSHWYTWLVEDQRAATLRADVASWKTDRLESPLTVTGDVAADLFASTSGTDSDWVVKLIDVYPDDPALGAMSGYQLMIAEEIFRGRYRASFSTPQPVIAGAVEEYKFSLHGTDHVFLKGHRLMVQVQSSWFPLYDRNPQTFVANIMEAKPGDYRQEVQKVYYSARYPSHVDLPVAAGK